MEIVTGIVSMPWEIIRGHALGNSITYAHPPPLRKMILRDQHLCLHSIKVPFTNLFWNLADGAIGTKVRPFFKKNTASSFFLTTKVDYPC
jgi:hypothetical protein